MIFRGLPSIRGPLYLRCGLSAVHSVDEGRLGGGAVLEAQTPHTAELANRLPLDTERQDMREQWLRRLLKNPLPSSTEETGPANLGFTVQNVVLEPVWAWLTAGAEVLLSADFTPFYRICPVMRN